MGLAWLQPTVAANSSTNSWHVTGELFLWGAGIGGDSVAGDIEVPFDKILDDLNMTFMGAIAVNNDKWAFAAEIIYLDVSDSETIRTTPINVSSAVAIETLITTFAAGYRLVDTQSSSLHGIFGARYLGLEAGIDLSIGNLPSLPYEGDEDAWDGVIGLRGEYRFNKHWALTYYGDVGSGDSELTWHAVAGVNYRFERTALVLGYSHMEWDFERPSLVSDLSISGPYAGFQFRFR